MSYWILDEGQARVGARSAVATGVTRPERAVACGGDSSVLIAVSPLPRGTLLLFIDSSRHGWVPGCPSRAGSHEQSYREYVRTFVWRARGSSPSWWRCWVTGKHTFGTERTPHSSPRVCPHPHLDQHVHLSCCSRQESPFLSASVPRNYLETKCTT